MRHRIHCAAIVVAAFAGTMLLTLPAISQQATPDRQKDPPQKAEQEAQAAPPRAADTDPRQAPADTQPAPQARQKSPAPDQEPSQQQPQAQQPQQQQQQDLQRRPQQPRDNEQDDAQDAERRDRRQDPARQQQAEQPMLGIEFGEGLAVQSTSERSAAREIGLRDGDEIVSIGGQNVRDRNQFRAMFHQQINRRGANRDFRIPIVVRRNGNLQTLYWTAAALGLAGYGPFGSGYRPLPPAYVEYRSGYRGDPGRSGAYLGVQLDPRYQNAAVVTEVHANTPAEKAGLQPGDVIWGVNDFAVNSPWELTQVIAQMQPGQEVEIRFNRPGNITVGLGERGEGEVRTEAQDASESPQNIPPQNDRQATPPAPPGPSPQQEAPQQ